MRADTLRRHRDVRYGTGIVLTVVFVALAGLASACDETAKPRRESLYDTLCDSAQAVAQEEIGAPEFRWALSRAEGLLMDRSDCEARSCLLGLARAWRAAGDDSAADVATGRALTIEAACSP